LVVEDVDVAGRYDCREVVLTVFEAVVLGVVDLDTEARLVRTFLVAAVGAR
jgi:hypothetical protein